MRPAAVRAWIRSNIDVPAEDLTRFIKQKGKESKQSIFENDVHWARFYLTKAGLIGAPRHGLWGLTPAGRDTKLTREDAEALCLRIRTSSRLDSAVDEENILAPGIDDTGNQDMESFWFVGARFGKYKADDQMPRFLKEGIWQNGDLDPDGRTSTQDADLIRQMKQGDFIAIKSNTVTSSHSPYLPFDVGTKSVAGMLIKATGRILENLDDGKSVKVAWDPPFSPRDWYFYARKNTIVKESLENEYARQLVDFTFRGVPQDYDWFLRQPYWVAKYGVKPINALAEPAVELPEVDEEEISEMDDEPSYGIDNIVADGSFLTAEELNGIIERWKSKKNLVLQGPPGTGKTWLAKRLGFALIGSNDRETTRSRLRIVQFHPSLAYEDFVRGWRPCGDGKLALVDGIFVEAIEAAASEPDRPFVLVIEEVNRGNPAQIFGEMLTLLENTQRRPSEAMELAYRKAPGERVHVPANLYVIGTMNIADRSLAIVDLALRRRFAFVDLEPKLGPAWHSWCIERGIDEAMLADIKTRIDALNAEIASAVSLGPQFRVGHSYVTPDIDEMIGDSRAWFRAKVETEIGPLLDEYWYDAPETARAARAKLLARLV